MTVFHFTKIAEKELSSFDASIQKLLIEGLTKMKDPGLLSMGSKKVVNLLPATHRLRIGNYRLLYKKTGDIVLILKIGHRKEIYR
ncbi:MAG: type II toxin-antitoxin system RelE/ParE family toxin [Candidatus Gracilibacteria bacterium]|nr:type II toxin-antitoxin system RelE/ParE family toxin [Candidatus Gracilibacteria bacterium]